MNNDGSAAAADPRARVVVLLAFDGFQTLDVTGPFEVFNSANVRKGKSAVGYRPIIASFRGGNVRANSGVVLGDTMALAKLPKSIDTVLIAGGDDDEALAFGSNPAVRSWMFEASKRARRYGSVCTGAFALGAMGLLEDRNVTTHWQSCDRLAAMFPRARVKPDTLYVEDRGLHTSAGVTSGMDMALSLVEADLGKETAYAVARHLVLFLRRPGGQSQLSAALTAQAHSSDRVRELLAWIVEHPDARLTLSTLAGRLMMSERTVTRRFHEETGMTPMEYIAAVRLDHARILLEQSDWPVERIAARSGFGSSDSLQRAFARRLGSTPREYRNQRGRLSIAAEPRSAAIDRNAHAKSRSGR
jgi:transcriptional regulator GlxA family with amidase domain